MNPTDTPLESPESYPTDRPRRAARSPWVRGPLLGLLVVGLAVGMDDGDGPNPDSNCLPVFGCEVLGCIVGNLTRFGFGGFRERTRATPGLPQAVRTLRPSDLSPGARFGAAVAADERLFVGAPFDAPDGLQTGSVHVFGDGDTQKIVPDDVGLGIQFGAAVDADGFLLAVGAPRAAPRGAVFLYENQGGEWTFLDRIDAPLPDAPFQFGHAVRFVDGQRPHILAVGAPGIAESGAVYVFEIDDREVGPPQVLTGDASFGGNAFGSSLDTVIARFELDPLLLVGAPDERGDPERSGAAYLFQRDAAFERVGKFTTSPGDAIQRLGAAVALHPGTAAANEDVTTSAFAGAPLVDTAEPLTGGWLHYRFVGEPDPPVTDAERTSVFDRTLPLGSVDGSSLAVRNDLLAVGAPATRTESVRVPGRVAVYRLRSVQTQVQFATTLRAPNAVPDDQFGAALAFRIGDLLVGAPTDGVAGAAYVFSTASFPVPAAKPEAAEREDRYLAFRADDDAAEPAFAQTLLGSALRPPFRVEITVGAFDASAGPVVTGSETGVCLALREGDAEPEFECVARLEDGAVHVEAGALGAPAAGALTITGDRVVDLAAEHDGSTLRFFARAHRAGEFEQVAAIADAGGAYRPGAFVRNLAPGAELGFDDPRIVRTTPPPADTEHSQAARELIYQALLAEAAFVNGLEVLAPDADRLVADHVEPSRAALAQAATRLRDAARVAAGKQERRRFSKARKQAKRSARHAKRAGKRAVKGKPVAKVLRLGDKAVDASAKALDLLGP